MGNKQGAKLEIGGKKWVDAGFFVEPTIFSNVTDDMDIAKDEVLIRYCIEEKLIFFIIPHQNDLHNIENDVVYSHRFSVQFNRF